MPVLVKICGITNAEDAVAAVEAGADALGFVFYELSPRFVPPQTAAEIIHRLPPHVVKVGVFVNPSDDVVLQAISTCGLHILQFHGDETPEQCGRYGLMSMKAFRVSGPESLAALESYSTDAWLLDAYAPGKPGGTGETFNWDLAIEAQKLGRPIFLAGGLTPENVVKAIRRVRPYGVDVSSGVEAAPGKKNRAKLAEFIRNAKTA